MKYLMHTHHSYICMGTQYTHEIAYACTMLAYATAYELLTHEIANAYTLLSYMYSTGTQYTHERSVT